MKKRMDTKAFLDHLETEEKRSALLERTEKDPAKKKREQKKRKRISKLIERVKKAATGGIETADARSLPDREIPGQVEMPGQQKTNH